MEGFCELGKRGPEIGGESGKETREMWPLSLGRASVGLLEQIKEWPVRGNASAIHVQLAWTQETLVAGSLWDQETQGHVDFIGFHSFCSKYLLCFCAFVIKLTQTHTHTQIHPSYAFPLSLLEWVLCS